MPAQKLTKARLAQILIMLSLLVGAFSGEPLRTRPAQALTVHKKSDAM